MIFWKSHHCRTAEGLTDPFLKILNGCRNIHSLLHKKYTCLCLTQCNLDWFHKKHPSVPRAVSIDQYYTITDFWLYTQVKKADAKNCTEKRSTGCSNLCAWIRCYARQHITRRTVSRNLKWTQQHTSSNTTQKPDLGSITQKSNILQLLLLLNYLYYYYYYMDSLDQCNILYYNYFQVILLLLLLPL